MTEVQLDDLNKGDKIRVILKNRAPIDGEFRCWVISKECRAIQVSWPCPIPGTSGVSTSVIRTRAIEKILRMGR